MIYSKQGDNMNKINRNVERLSFDIRRAENLAMQTKQIGDQKVCGWGIHFDLSVSKNSYIIFSDFCDETTLIADKQYTENEKQEVIKLSSNIVLKETDLLDIVFTPPEPTLILVGTNGLSAHSGNISIGSENGSLIKTLTIDEIGNVNVK